MGREPLTIDRCVCHQVGFAELLPIARSQQCQSIEGLQQHASFGEGCELCHPYVRRMLRTGETAFHEVITD